MNRSINLVMCSIVAATLLTGTIFLPSSAAPKATPVSAPLAAASQAQPQVFTIRYVCFVAQPKVAETLTPAEALARAAKLPPILIEMQHGSRRSMDLTPDSFLSDLEIAQADHNFHLLLCGSAVCTNDNPAATVLGAGPYPGDPLQAGLSEHITLSRNSPVMVTIHHTGKFTYTNVAGIHSQGWIGAHADNVVIGRTYSQGVNDEMDGSRFVYAMCILPGNLDKTASAWSKAVKAIASHKAAAHSRTAVR